MNTFKDWCIQNNIYTTDTGKCSHLLLNGGKLCIPEQLHDEFINMYVKSLQNNEKVYLVEKLSKEIKLFIDIDSKSSMTIDVCILVDRINEILPIKNHIYKCSKTNGYHIVYSDRIVEPEEACEIVKALQNKLVNKYAYELKEIQNIIDTSVYKTGLRMIGSYKIDDLRCYLPVGTKNRKQIDYTNVSNSLIRASHENYSSTKTNETILSDNSDQKIIKEIERLHKNYKDIKITKVKKIDDTFVIGTNSKFCMNKNGLHDNHVYFVITKDKKISQKCFCSNNNTKERLHGVCSKYKSKCQPFGHMAYCSLLKSF